MQQLDPDCPDLLAPGARLRISVVVRLVLAAAVVWLGWRLYLWRVPDPAQRNWGAVLAGFGGYCVLGYALGRWCSFQQNLENASEGGLFQSRWAMRMLVFILATYPGRLVLESLIDLAKLVRYGRS